MSEKKTVTMARTFASAAYLREEDPGTFTLWRDIEVECRDPKTGSTYREKTGKKICASPVPLRRFDQKTDNENSVVLRTVHPNTGEVLRLVEVEHR